MKSVDDVVEQTGKPFTVFLIVDALADQPFCPTTLEVSYRLAFLCREGRLKNLGYDRDIAGNRARRYIRNDHISPEIEPLTQ